MANNISKLYRADVKLNEDDKNYKKMLVIENNSGVLFIDNNLCSISYTPQQTIDVIVKNKFNILNMEL